MFIIHFKLCRQIKTPYIYRSMSNVHRNAELLTDLIGLSHSEAVNYLTKNKIREREPEDMAECIKYCQNLGYDKGEILSTPHLLKVTKIQLEQHYWTLEEGGFQNIKPYILSQAVRYMKRPIYQLKYEQLISKKTNVLKNFLSYIKDPLVVEEEMLKKSEYSDNDMWSEVHYRILKTLLKRKLEATEDDLIKLFRIHKMIKYKSFRVIQENIQLALEIGMEPRKILSYGYILNSYPGYTKTTLKDLSNLAGADIRKGMRNYPKLFMTSPKNILKIYGILKEFDIPDEIIGKQLNVFHMSPETVRMRLEAIRDSPDLKVLLKHPRIVSLIVHHNRAKTRLSFLQLLKLRCASLTILDSPVASKFQDYVQEGKDVNQEADVFAFFNSSFSRNEQRGLKKKIKMHPFYLHVPIKDMSDTYHYLLQCDFRQGNIARVIWILLYPVKKVSQTLNRIKEEPDFKYETLNQVQQLNLVLYLIEKDHHFTGNGIWQESILEELQEKCLE